MWNFAEHFVNRTPPATASGIHVIWNSIAEHKLTNRSNFVFAAEYYKSNGIMKCPVSKSRKHTQEIIQS